MSFNRKHIRAAAMGRVIHASAKKDDAEFATLVRAIAAEMLEAEKTAQAAETVAEATRKRLVVPNG